MSARCASGLLVAVAAILFAACHRKPPASSTTPVARQALSFPERRWISHGLTCASGKCKVKIVLSIKPVCYPGDLDFITTDLNKFSPVKELLLTVEPVVLANGAPIFRKTLPLAALADGATFDIELPADGRGWGVFLCRDVKKQGRCGQKVAVPGNTALALNAGSRARDPKFEAPDLTYYFQYFWVSEGRAYFAREMNDANLADEVFDERVATIGAASRDDIDRVASYYRRLRSMPLASGITSGGLELVLPRQLPGCH